MMKGDDEDLGEKKWELAQKQMSSRDLIEANSSLSEAEKLFSLSGNKKRSFDVFVEESKLHLCLGLVNEATKEIEKAMELMKEIPQMEEDMGVIFQSGLVHLCKGSENEAHHDLTKYIELAEITGDIEAQARGHFYLALIYDGHNEPCMATAELELGRDISKDLEHKKYYTASTAYLAHLWIAKGEMKIAEPMVDESLRLVERIEEGSSLALGMAMLMSAEIRASSSDQEGSENAFARSIEAFHRSYPAHYLEAFAHSCYGKILLKNNRAEQGCLLLTQARSRFERLFNASQVSKVENIMNGNDRCSCEDHQ